MTIWVCTSFEPLDCLLADEDTGLGKTIQVISFLAAIMGKSDLECLCHSSLIIRCFSGQGINVHKQSKEGALNS